MSIIYIYIYSGKCCLLYYIFRQCMYQYIAIHSLSIYKYKHYFSIYRNILLYIQPIYIPIQKNLYRGYSWEIWSIPAAAGCTEEECIALVFQKATPLNGWPGGVWPRSFFGADMLHFFVVALELEHNHGSKNYLCKRHVMQSYLMDAEGGIFLR